LVSSGDVCGDAFAGAGRHIAAERYTTAAVVQRTARNMSVCVC